MFILFCGRALLLFYSYCQRRVLGSRGLLVVYVLTSYQTLRVVPHGTKGTGPRFVTRPAYLRSQFRNNTNTAFITGSLRPILRLLQKVKASNYLLTLFISSGMTKRKILALFCNVQCFWSLQRCRNLWVFWRFGSWVASLKCVKESPWLFASTPTFCVQEFSVYFTF